MSLPAQVKLSEFQVKMLDPGLPFVSIELGENHVLSVEPTTRQSSAFGSAPVSLKALTCGQATVELKLFGRFPIKRVSVEVVPRIWLVPGGHSIGVLLRADGVIVTKLVSVTDNQGKTWTPAKDAGLLPGDVILKADELSIRSEEGLARALDRAGSEDRLVVLEIRRGTTQFKRPVRPVLCGQTRRYRIGAYVRDGAAGVGTLTFYDRETSRYAALGHIITDGETGTPVAIYDGKVVRAQVTGIEEGRRGHPGEKMGVFLEDNDVIGTIDRNTEFGISGTLYTDLSNPFYDGPIAMGLISEVQEGPAQILTVVDGHKVERFDVLIQRVNRQSRPEIKGMVVKIVDPVLLGRTGGIIQGMSGSPIIQNGKLVGAITHVLVNDPTKGYGVFAEWMVEKAGITPKVSDAGHRIDAQRLFLLELAGM